MDLILEQFEERVKLILCIIVGILFVMLVIDPIVKRIDRWRENRHDKSK